MDEKTVSKESYLGDPLTFFTFWIAGIALLAGFALSIVSSMGLCTANCSQTKDYQFFGFPFALFGIIFFTVALLLHFLSSSFSKAALLSSWILAGALGAEIVFIGIQKYQIGQWCPICLSIAVCVFIACACYAVSYFSKLKSSIRENRKGEIMQSLWKSFSSFSFMFLGFLIAFVGISKPDYELQAKESMRSKLAMGNPDSDIKVYIVSDWFCAACKKIEPQLKEMAPMLMQKAQVYFVDYPLHPETANFTPYSMAFLVNDKENYFKARKALAELANRTKEPDDDDIEQAAESVGANFDELRYRDIQAGLTFFKEVANKYGITGTPEMIIVNTQTDELKRLKGSTEITRENVRKALNAVSN